MAAGRLIGRALVAAVVASLCASLLAPSASAATYSATVKRSQEMMIGLGLPTGKADGYFGAQTARGLCAFRHIAGRPVSRANVSAAEYQLLTSYSRRYPSLQKIPAKAYNGRTTYLLAHEHCQVMFYVENGYYKKVMRISTARAGKNTPNGTYWLGSTQKGWSCSSLYPESCTRQTTGRFVTPSSYGNMYNKRTFSGAYKVHGSTSVPTYPASAGCIRVTVGDSDWMYDHVGNDGPTYLAVVGAY